MVTDLDFEDATVPDVAPITEDVEYPCQYIDDSGAVCGRESGPYGGRGRKPKFCDLHKANKVKGAAPRVAGAHAALARQALEALVNFHNTAAFIAMALGFQNTAMAITTAEDEFRRMAITPLMADRKLCERILKGGTNSAMVGMLIAYGTFGAAVVPTAALEYRVRTNAKRGG